MQYVLTVALALGTCVAALAAPLSYYLPPEETYDPVIPTPEAFIGHEVGSFVVRPDLVTAYARELDRLSDRITLEIIGYTHERRPIIALTVTSPENHARLEELRVQHLPLSDPLSSAEPSDKMPVVTWMGFGVHGDEISSMDAAMLAMYHVAAATSDAARDRLAAQIVQMVPTMNPDGFGRASQWFNMSRGEVAVTDEQNREHLPGWPRGRGNHYWFDLNRQWVIQTQPEPEAWLKLFHRWKPNLMVDFHEMNADATYFFSPGIPTQVNPYIGKATRDVQRAIAGRFATTLDDDRDFYFSEEFFDEFNPAMGSNFPAINGGVGYLFENRGFTGRAVENDTGVVTYESRIRRHLRTALTVIEAAADNRPTLLKHQREFYKESLAMARGQRIQAYVFAAPNDSAKSNLFLDVLGRHQIRAYPATRDMNFGGRTFRADETYVVPVAQPQYRVIQNIFETRTQFDDIVFYDISTWNMPLAYGLKVAAVQTTQVDGMAGRVATPAFPAQPPPPKSNYAYAFSWDGLYAPRAAQRILAAGGRARVALDAFTGVTSSGPVKFPRGSIVVPVGEEQPLTGDALHALMSRIARDDAVAVYALPTGRTGEGPDLGSNAVVPLQAPKPLIVGGDPVRFYDSGELWHLLDRFAEVPTSIRDAGAFRTMDLTKYTHIILPDGNYASWGDEQARAIDAWTKAGGILVATKRGAVWAVRNNLIETEIIDDRADAGLEPPAPKVHAADEKSIRRDYAAKEATEAAERIRGAIFSGDLDVTHPIGFGAADRDLAIFRDTRVILAPPKNPFATVVAYRDAPPLSGYVSPENLKRLPGTAAVIADRRGKGAVVLFADNPAFRAYWYGTAKLMLNALFFGHTLMPEGQRFSAGMEEE